eukprot:8745594-Pyramimonas_sp.AAC.1
MADNVSTARAVNHDENAQRHVMADGWSNADLGGHSAKKTDRHAAFRTALKLVQTHPAWKSGAQIDAPWMALKPSLVDLPATRDSISAKASRIFYHSDVPIPNPAGTAQPRLPCCMLHGGLCKRTDGIERIKNFAANFHFGVRGHVLPLLVEIGGDGGEASETHLLLDRVGRGELHVLLRVSSSSPASKIYDVVDGGNYVFATSHMGGRRILSNIVRARGLSGGISDIETVRLRVYDFKDGRGHNCNRFRIRESGLVAELPLGLAAKAKAKKIVVPATV